jgi:hypothetical protein
MYRRLYSSLSILSSVNHGRVTMTMRRSLCSMTVYARRPIIALTGRIQQQQQQQQTYNRSNILLRANSVALFSSASGSKVALSDALTYCRDLVR